MKLRYYVLLGLVPLLQVAWGGYSKYRASHFVSPTPPVELDQFISSQLPKSESAGWLVASSNELKRYGEVYGALKNFGIIQSEIILYSGFAQVLFLVAVVIGIQKTKQNENRA